MGNTQSDNVNGSDYDKYIEEQQHIINLQREQIDRLSRNLPQSSHQQISGNNNEQRNNVNEVKKNKLDMILSIFDLDRNYNEKSLKKAYLKLAMIHHPDRGGTPESFKKLEIGYKLLLKKLSEKESNKDHSQLKQQNKEYLSQQDKDTPMNININLNEKFDNNVFNKIYEENRSEDIYDKGYDEWMKSNDVDEEETNNNQKKLRKNFNKTNFNKEFDIHKKNKLGDQIIEYHDPKVDISFKGKDSIVELGKGNISNLSGESQNGLCFTDYKEAYTNTCLIDINSIDISKRSKSIRDQTLERKNISYSMSENDLKIQTLKELEEKREEEKRIQNLSLNDQKAFNTYEAVHKRMLGHR